MPSLKKIKSGLLYEETFNGSNLIWQLFPNDSNIEIDNGFKLKTSDRRVMLLTELPHNDFILQAKIKHEPLSINSFAGVILYKDNESWVECQTYWNDEREETVGDVIKYPYIKLLKKDNMFTFYGSTNGNTWSVVGATRINDVDLYGFFFEPNDSVDRECIIENICMCSSTFLNMVGLRRGDNVTLYDGVTMLSSKTAVDGANSLLVPLLSSLAPLQNIRIKIQDVFGSLIVEDTVSTLYPGDAYKLSLNIDFVLIDGRSGTETILQPGEFYDFGHIIEDSKRVKMYIRNNDELYQPRNFIVSVEEYSLYYKGPKQVSLAFCGYETIYEDVLEWCETITIPELEAGKKYFVWMKIDRDKTDIAAFISNQYKYKITMG